jgi:ABC-type proline/glycine betaine transport system ATPase subunit
MNNGHVEQIGHPHVLLNDPKSILYNLVKELDEKARENLRNTSERNYKTITKRI